MNSDAQKRANLKKWGELLDAEAGIDVSNWQPPAIDSVAASAYPARAASGFDMDFAAGADKQDATAQFATWPDPVPLPDGLPPVQAFDAELLPEALRC